MTEYEIKNLKADNINVRTIHEVLSFLRENNKSMVIVDKDIALKFLTNNGENLIYCSEEIRNNSKLVIAGLMNNVKALEYASDALKDNPHIIIETLKTDPIGIKYASERMQNFCKNLDNPILALEIMIKNNELLNKLDSNLEQNKLQNIFKI